MSRTRTTSARAPTPSRLRNRRARLIGAARSGWAERRLGSRQPFSSSCSRKAGSGRSTGAPAPRKSGSANSPARGHSGSGARPLRRHSRSQAIAAPASARSASSQARLRRRWVLSRRSLTSIQSSTSSKRRGSSRPTSKLSRRSASGSAAQRSRRGEALSIPICAHCPQRKELSPCWSSSLSSWTGIVDPQVRENLVQDRREGLGGVVGTGPMGRRCQLVLARLQGT